MVNVPITLAAVFAFSAQAASADSGSSPRMMQGCAGDSDCDGTPDSSDACPTKPASPSTGGCPDPDTDGDYVTDSRDACPTVAAPNSPNGCPDGDGDGVADADDACPDRPGPAANKGCGDGDRDGLTDDVDLCPDEGKDPIYQNRRAGPDGCYPTLIEVYYGADTPERVALDTPGGVVATCDYNHSQKCAVRMTMTLSERSAKALGRSSNPRIADLTIPLTTQAQKDKAKPRQPSCGCRPAPQGTLKLGLSANLKKKIARLSSLTMTMRVTYTVGSNAPETMKMVFKLSRRADPFGKNRLSNMPDFNEEFEEDMSGLDDPEG